MDDVAYDHSVPRRSDGTRQTLREALPWPEDRPFRILSIDGGGICGLLPALVLSELERRFLRDAGIGRYFDMIAGTSTGGIIALGLGQGMTGQQIAQVYLERGETIFPPRNWIGRKLLFARRATANGYDPRVLEAELRRLFGDRLFGSSTSRLCIPAFEGRYGEPFIYKTPHHPDYKKDRFERLVNVGLATAAAPTYYTGHLLGGYTMLDGGIWANNPMMIALTDALACFRIERRQVRILSLGCGQGTFRTSERLRTGGWVRWAIAFRDAAMRAQSHNALGQAYLLVGKDQVRRLDAPESAAPIPMDDVRRACKELPHVARALVESAGHDLCRLFLSEPAEAVQFASPAR